MKPTRVSSIHLALLAGIMTTTSALAVINIDYATVGDAGNAGNGGGLGSVAYEYRIAKNETTISQYTEFLNAVAKTDAYSLYNASMTTGYVNGISQSLVAGSFTYAVATGSANKPVTFVSWFDAARFCNWLQNGQQTGAGAALTAEDGAYTLSGATSGIITRNVGATVWIPTEGEWYKAAYFDANKGGAGAGGYWLQATRSDTLGGNSIGGAHSANYWDGDFVGYPGAALTDVGAYGTNSESAYGTNDQGGNVWEWNDAVSGSSRGLRGGAWSDLEYDLSASNSTTITPSYENGNLGFRIASVPEPTAILLTLLPGGLLTMRRKR